MVSPHDTRVPHGLIGEIMMQERQTDRQSHLVLGLGIKNINA